MPDPQTVTAAIARNVRTHRGRHGWTLDALSARSGLSKGMLVQVEAARTNPSIATLCRLADALGVPLARLVDVAEAPAVRLVPAGEAVTLWRGGAGSTGTLLAGADGPTQLEFWDWRMAPGDGYDGEAHPAGSRELLTVLGGRLTLTVGAEEVVADEGDTVLFAADRPHRYANQGRRPLRFVLVVTQPPAPPEGPVEPSEVTSASHGTLTEP